jgi:phosphoribosylanthranilate isomerase
MTRVKICGCMSVADALAARDAGADFIGIMFAHSRRRVALDEAAAIAAALGAPLRDVEQVEPPPLHPGQFAAVEDWYAHGAEALDRLLARKRPLVVGVFADQPIDEVNDIADDVGLDLLQFSGNEPWSDCLLATRQTIKVIAPAPGESGDGVFGRIEAGAALAIMLDASRGTGTPLDAGLARDVAARIPIWLAGGLTPDNVAATIATVRPYAVDVSTGVETRGDKDPQKIAAFIHAAKAVAV